MSSMSTLLITHSTCLEHDTGMGHPERPDRLRAIQSVLSDSAFDTLIREEAPFGKEEDILRAHPQSHIDMVKASIPDVDYQYLDGDTLLCPNSLEPVFRAVGAATYAVDQVMGEKVHNAFCAMRPPGHHAEKTKAMGFCFFNNIAVAAYYAREKYGCERVAVVDFDVHHGNGTQDIFWNDPNMFYASCHEMPLFPGTGSASERGAGNIFNLPLQPGSDGNSLKTPFQEVILKNLEAFNPDLLLISAGFDAHVRDPLSSINWNESDFMWITQSLLGIANQKTQGKVVSILEGGYDLKGLSSSVAIHIVELMKNAS